MKIYRISQSIIKAYHGTCSSYYDLISEGNATYNGLKNPYLAKYFDLAKYYAEQISAMTSRLHYDYGSPIILEVTIHNIHNLRYDANSMDEPVMASENERDMAWNKAAQEHPEWVRDDMIFIPETEWEISWNAVGTAKYEGIIPLEHIIALT